jgi:uncharacterized protein (TIGR00730 family)
MTSVRISSICVYCGSSSGRQPAYVAAARDLARTLAARQIRLIYGGARVGLMGALADEVLAAGGSVTGVIPRALAGKEIAHDGLSELIVTESMHARKTIMAERADACIALPGGIGTLEELFEAWTWTQLGFHRKPCGLLNVARYFDALIQFADHAVAEGYMTLAHRHILLVDEDSNRLIDRLASCELPVVPKWLDEGNT